MDHKWGRNVTEYGIGSFDCTLCARRLDLDNFYVTNSTYASGFMVWFFRLPADEHSPYIIGVAPVVPPGKNFPYQWDVEPDAPV